MKNAVRLFLVAAVVLVPLLALASAPVKGGGRPDLERLFAARGLAGCFTAMTPAGTVSVDPARCGRPFPPGSTFEIVNALTAFDIGMANPAYLIPWDNIVRRVPAWNADLMLSDAFRSSAPWYFVELARLSGRANLQAAMRRLDYGNADASGPDRFWFDGRLRISAAGQMRALERLARGKAGFSPRSLDMLRHVMLLKKGGEAGMDEAPWALYGKAGLALPAGEDDAAPGVGWFVGWVERGGAVYPFALNVSPAGGGPMTAAQLAGRIPLAETLLRRLGVLPGSSGPDLR